MKRDVLLLVVGLCAVVVGVAAIRTWQHGGSRDATAAGATRAVQGPADPVPTVTPVTPSGDGPLDPATLADAFGIHFTIQAVDNGGRPTLPNGQQGVSREQAIRAAMDHSLVQVDQAHNLLPNVQVLAQYGLFTRARPGRQLHPNVQNRPAWVITFSGPGVVIYPSGPAAPGSVHHEVTVVIDAATGEYLLGYSYR